MHEPSCDRRGTKLTMKRNLTLFRGARLGLLALALPLLSACYSTVGYDGRTMLRPLSSPGPYYSTATLSAPMYGPAHPGLIPIGGYRAVQGYTYYTPPPWACRTTPSRRRWASPVSHWFHGGWSASMVCASSSPNRWTTATRSARRSRLARIIPARRLGCAQESATEAFDPCQNYVVCAPCI